ncbi:MAG: phosphatase PAP2 family protein [Armatimonadota bacterium]
MRSRLTDFILAVWGWMRRHPGISVALIVAGIALDAFFEVADELVEDELGPFDSLVQHLIAQFRSPGLLLLSRVLTEMLYFPFVVILALPFFLYLLWTRRFVLAGGLVAIPAVAGLLILLLKAFFQRQRPLEPLLPVGGYSFPSGHAFSSVVIYGLLGYVAWRCFTRRRWLRVLIVIVVVLLALATGFARVYLGAHFTSDVLGGWAGGLAVLAGGIALLEALQRRWK